MFSSLFGGSNGNVVAPKVYLKFIAVGGTTGDRLKRDGLLRKMAPDLKSVALLVQVMTVVKEDFSSKITFRGV